MESMTNIPYYITKARFGGYKYKRSGNNRLFSEKQSIFGSPLVF
jgi:hypothetical protein